MLVLPISLCPCQHELHNISINLVAINITHPLWFSSCERCWRAVMFGCRLLLVSLYSIRQVGGRSIWISIIFRDRNVVILGSFTEIYSCLKKRLTLPIGKYTDWVCVGMNHLKFVFISNREKPSTNCQDEPLSWYIYNKIHFWVQLATNADCWYPGY